MVNVTWHLCGCKEFRIHGSGEHAQDAFDKLSKRKRQLITLHLVHTEVEQVTPTTLKESNR